MATITLYELGNYNNGILIAQTFELSDERTLDKEIQEWLEELTDETGQLCEEWNVADSEGIPSQYVSDYSIDNEFWEWLELELPEDIKQAGIDCGIAVADIEEAYAGSFRSDEDFAWKMADEMCSIDNDAQWPHNCIDWERAARELMYDYCSSDGHYFRML